MGHKKFAFFLRVSGTQNPSPTEGLLGNKPIICGGEILEDDWNGDGIQRSRLELENNFIVGKSMYYIQLLEKRFCAASVALNKTNLWVTGGSRESFSKDLPSTELISLHQPPVKGQDLPFTVAYHSMTLIDSKTMFLIGGMQDSNISKNTWIIDPTKNFEIKSGPDLNEERGGHSCSKMKIDGKTYLIVAGGTNESTNNYLDSVEILDTTSLDQAWKLGNNF